MGRNLVWAKLRTWSPKRSFSFIYSWLLYQEFRCNFSLSKILNPAKGMLRRLTGPLNLEVVGVHFQRGHAA